MFCSLAISKIEESAMWQFLNREERESNESKYTTRKFFMKKSNYYEEQ